MIEKYPLLTSPSPRITPIIKVVGENCNLKCDYCFFYNDNQSQREIMSYDILNSFITQYVDLFKENITFIWHGGEPLLAGINFYQQVVEIEKSKCNKNQKIHNSIQTNGTLITDSWAKFFKDNNFSVGVSLDGIPPCHNKFRKNVSHQGSFEETLRGIELLRKYGIEPGIIQTVTKSTIGYAKENFSFFTDELKLKQFGINFFNDIDGTNPIMANESISDQEYFGLLKKYFDLWITKNDPKLKIREIDSFIFGLLGKKSVSCTSSGTCSSFMTVNWDGEIFIACERLSSQVACTSKNIKNVLLVDMINDSKRLEFASKINKVHDDCEKCTWFYACHNGCTSHRKGGLDGKYAYCDARKLFFNYLSEKLNIKTEL